MSRSRRQVIVQCIKYLILFLANSGQARVDFSICPETHHHLGTYKQESGVNIDIVMYLPTVCIPQCLHISFMGDLSFYHMMNFRLQDSLVHRKAYYIIMKEENRRWTRFRDDGWLVPPLLAFLAHLGCAWHFFPLRLPSTSTKCLLLCTKDSLSS